MPLGVPARVALRSTVCCSNLIMENPSTNGISGNGGFSLANYHAIGFDMDHTLVRYKVDALQEHVFWCAVEYLVTVAKYPESLRSKPFSSAKFIKGVFADKLLGNFLKLDSNRRVIIAYHGTHRYSDADIARLYPDPIPFKGVTTSRFWACTSYFDMPYFSAYALLIDMVDEQVGSQMDHLSDSEKECLYDDINHDIFKCILYNFGDFHGGWYFKELVANTSKYIDRRPQVRDWLATLRTAGKRTFLITNSGEEYTELLMTYAFGSDWRTLFDLVVLRARKPSFFIDTNPFYEVVDGKQSKDVASTLEFGRMYVGGNCKQLIKDLGWGVSASQVLYCGDEPVGDVMAPAVHVGWQTAAVVEELEALDFDADLTFGDELDSACFHYTEQWGSFFFADDSRQRFSYWGYLLDTNASIYLPCVSRFSRFGISHIYVTHKESASTEPQIFDVNTVTSAHARVRDTSAPTEPLLTVDAEAVADAAKVMQLLEDKKKKAELRRLSINRS